MPSTAGELETTALLGSRDESRHVTSPLFSRQNIQLFSCRAGFFLDFVVLALGIAWAWEGKNGLHPIAMILSYFFLTIAMFIYRIIPSTRSERALQRAHYLLIGVAFILGGVAVHAVTKRQHKSKRGQHTILGYTAIYVMLIQFLFGGGSISLIRRNRTHWMVLCHKKCGPLIYGVFTVALLDGLLSHKCHHYCGLQLWLILTIGLTTLCALLGVTFGEPPHENMTLDEEAARIRVSV